MSTDSYISLFVVNPLVNNASLFLDVTCAENEFTCANGNCIPNAYKCDNEDDCDDQSDEKGCSGKKVKYQGLQMHQVHDSAISDVSLIFHFLCSSRY